MNQIEKNKRDKWTLIQQNRASLDKIEKENRSMNTEERAEFDKVNKKIDEHDGRIKDLEKLNTDDDEPVEGGEPTEDEMPAERNRQHRGEVRNRPGRFSQPIDLTKPGETRAHGSKKYRENYRHWLATGEKRDVIMGTSAVGQGGNLLAPVQASDDIVKQIDNLVFVRQLARIYKVDKAVALGVRQMTARVSDSAWTTEIQQITADTSLAFNQRDLTPNMLAKLVLVSLRLMNSGVAVEATVNEELAYKNAVSEENAFMNGDGTAKPLGVFVASAQGVPTSQDITSGASGDFIADDLIKMRYGLKQPYFTGDKARWALHRSIVQEVRTFKDSYGQYLWRPGLAGNAPDTILDVPIAMSEYAPSAKAAGNYIAVLGNFGYYAIADVKDWEIQRLVERYADTSEIGYIGRRWVDGGPVLGEAFVRLKCAA